MSSGTLRITKTELERLFSILRKDQHGRWKRKSEASKKMGLSRTTVDKILSYYPNGLPQKPKLTTPQFVSDYRESICHKKIVAIYTDKVTKKMSPQGSAIDRMGLDLYQMFKADPATLSIEQFRAAKDDPRFTDPKTGTIFFREISAIRIIMTMAGIDPKRYPEFTTKGTKRPPQKKGDYLDETELIQFIYGIDRIDTLVYYRLSFEGGGRFSSTVDVATDKIAYELHLIMMYEPKVRSSEERYFLPCTLNFVRQYIRDFSIIGKLFRRSYFDYENDLLRAGQRAGLFRYTGQHEIKMARDKGKRVQTKVAKHEGKKTSTHVVGKHTFVSLSSLHGFGLDDVSEQTGTDPSTLKKYYLGVGKKKLKGVILGEQDFEPWCKWIPRVLEPHWQKRYAQLKAAAGKAQ